MAKNILYLAVILAAFFIILFSQQINIVVKVIALLTMAVGAAVMIDAIVKQIKDKKEN